MKEHIKCLVLCIIFVAAASTGSTEVMQAWVGLAIAAAGAISSAYGASEQSKAAGANQDAANQAREDELKRREAVGKELKKAYKAYENLRKERPGVSFDQFKQEYVGAITDPAFADAFRKVKEEDFLFAQKLADRATTSNVEGFSKAVDTLSGGAYDKLRSVQNDIALTSDSESAVKRALEMRAAYIPAGSVRLDSKGRFVEGQRADKQVFTTAYEQDLAARDRQFRMSGDLARDYSSIAERQQERAKDFINFGSIEPIARGFVGQAIQNAVNFQIADETNQFQLIRDYNNALFSNQTQQPQYQNPNAYNGMITAGIDSAIKGLSTYANNNPNAFGSGSGTGGKSSSDVAAADSAFGHGYGAYTYL